MPGMQGCWIAFAFPTVPFLRCSLAAACPSVILQPLLPTPPRAILGRLGFWWQCKRLWWVAGDIFSYESPKMFLCVQVQHWFFHTPVHDLVVFA